MSNATLDFFNSLLPDTISLANIKDDRPNADPDYNIGPDFPAYLNGPSYFDSRITNSTGGLLNLNSPTGTLAQQFSYNSWCGDVVLPIPLRPQTGDPTNPNFSYIDANGNNNWDIGNIPGVDDIRIYNNVAVVSSYLSLTTPLDNAASTYSSIFSSLSLTDGNTDGYVDALQRVNWLFNFVIEPQQLIAANTNIAGTSGNFSLGYGTYFVDLDGATGGYTAANADGLNGIDANDFFSLGDVQLAIWRLLGQTAGTGSTNEASTITSDARANTLVTLATANGSNFVAAAGQDAVVILNPTYGTTRYQPILIEVEVPAPPTPIPTTFTVSGYKWLDTDTQGDWDAGNETGIEGWTIYLDNDTNLGNGFIRSATTNDQGLYSLALGTFTGATTQTFYIYENNINGWTNSYNGATRLDVTTSVDVPTGNISISKVVVNGTSTFDTPTGIQAALNGAINNAESLNFGNYFTISGSKYIDANGDRSINGDLKSTTPFTINLYAWGDGSDNSVQDGIVQDSELTFIADTQTVNGDYRFTGLGFLEEGFKYYIQEEVPSGWTQTFGNSGYVIDPTTGVGATGNIFANFQDFSIGGTKYLDANGDGLTTGDVGLEGVKIFIDADGNGSLNGNERFTTTNTDGSWSFANLDLSDVGKLVREVVPSGYAPTLGANGLIITNPGSGGILSGLDFANKPLGGDLTITKTDGLDCIKPGSQLTYTIVVSNTGLGTATNAKVQDNISPLLTNVTWTSVASGGASGNDNGSSNILYDEVTLVGGSSITYTVTGTVAANALQPTSYTSASFNLQGSSATSGTFGNSRTFSAGGITATARAFNLSGSSWTTAYLGSYSGGLGVTNRNEGTGANNTHVTDNSGSLDYIALQFDQAIAIDKTTLGYVVGDSDFRYWVGTSNSDITTTNIASVLSGSQLTEANDGGSSTRTADINSGNVVGNFFVIAARPDQTDDGFKVKTLDILKPNAPSPVVLSNTATVTAPNGFIDSNLANNSATDTTTIQSPTPPSSSCQEIIYKFEGNTALCGSYGNVRNFSQSGVNVQASAFSRNTTNGWQNAYLGLFGDGLGVTNRNEGDGSNGNHRLDNGGSQDYILFKFSDSVRVDRAYLDSVVGDSDITVWFGNSNATSVNDTLLNSLTKEDNNTTSSSARWADFNAQQLWGNTLVIGASISDSTPDDAFKVNFLDICAITSPTTTPIC